jgi:kynurenine 3-monooxygenase
VAWLPGGGARLTREPTQCGTADDDEACAVDDDATTTKATAAASAVPRRVRRTIPVVARPRVVTVPFVVGAEGASTRNAVMRAMDGDGACATTMVRFEDANPRVYKTIPIKLPSTFRTDLNYSARTKGGVALECLPTKEGLLVGILLVKPGDAETCDILESKESLRKYFDEDFPMFAQYVSDEDLELMAGRRLSTLPTFAYAGGECLHRVVEDAAAEVNAYTALEEVGGACLLGDSIHTVKPYFGLGVNSAFEDVTILGGAVQVELS